VTGARGAVRMDGVRFADEIVQRLRDEIAAAGNPRVTLGTVIVTAEHASLSNLRRKHARAREAGMTLRDVRLPANARQRDLAAAVSELAADPDVDGIFVQVPLPASLDLEAVVDLIPPGKDVDGATAQSLGNLMRGRAGHVPCTPLAILRLLHRYGVTIAGRRTIIVGRTPEIGLPLAFLFARAGAAASIMLADARAPDIVPLCRQADIVVSAVGEPHTIGRNHIKPGAAVVDAGVSRTENGIVGDVDFAAAETVAAAIVPMPGGAGPATIACLLENTWSAARAKRATARA